MPLVAMNAETYGRDVKEVAPGGYLIYDSTWPRPAAVRASFHEPKWFGRMAA